MQKKIKPFYYDKIMVHFCKGCDVNMFFFLFVEEIIEAVSSIAKTGGQK